MRISSVFQVIKVSAVPLLFAAAALGLATVHVSLQRKAERARSRATQAAAIQDRLLPNPFAGLKLPDLAAAVKKGDLPAKIEMGRRLAQGEGVKKNEAQAALYFQAVIDEAGEIGARDKRGPLVATAFRYLAHFHRRGVPEAKIAANPAYAFGLLHHAASYFGDPVAQYELAKLLMNGDGVTKNPRAAAAWLLSAARKGYAPAQAMLGEMLWRGNGVTRVAGDGLGLLAIARRNAAPEDKVWVSKMFETARAEALPAEILEANAFIVQGSQAAHLGAGPGNLIGAEGAEGSVAPPPSDAAGQQNPIVHGMSHPLPGLRAGPAFLPLEPFSGELTVEKNGAQALAGIIQMYQIWEQETWANPSLPVRVAGVTE
jgi:TPR repeat protein